MVGQPFMCTIAALMRVLVIVECARGELNGVRGQDRVVVPRQIPLAASTPTLQKCGRRELRVKQEESDSRGLALRMLRSWFVGCAIAYVRPICDARHPKQRYRPNSAGQPLRYLAIRHLHRGAVPLRASIPDC